MKSTELMIGDWVQIAEPCKYAGAIGRVKTLIDHKDDENAYFKVFLKNNTIHIGIEDICSDDIRPIPLTPEILEKNGFIKESREFQRNTLQYCVLTDGLWIDISEVNYFEGKLEFVHQLQHALKLCGITREIII